MSEVHVFLFMAVFNMIYLHRCVRVYLFICTSSKIERTQIGTTKVALLLWDDISDLNTCMYYKCSRTHSCLVHVKNS